MTTQITNFSTKPRKPTKIEKSQKKSEKVKKSQKKSKKVTKSQKNPKNYKISAKPSFRLPGWWGPQTTPPPGIYSQRHIAGSGFFGQNAPLWALCVCEQPFFPAVDSTKFSTGIAKKCLLPIQIAIIDRETMCNFSGACARDFFLFGFKPEKVVQELVQKTPKVRLFYNFCAYFIIF
jgi:hypothetical protein